MVPPSSATTRLYGVPMPTARTLVGNCSDMMAGAMAVYMAYSTRPNSSTARIDPNDGPSVVMSG
ncbi:hypothetical protein D3C78_1927690 [compost metagenome]